MEFPLARKYVSCKLNAVFGTTSQNSRGKEFNDRRLMVTLDNEGQANECGTISTLQINQLYATALMSKIFRSKVTTQIKTSKRIYFQPNCYHRMCRRNNILMKQN